MIKRLLILALILVCHAAAFVDIYFGRITGVAMCGSDILLFAIPFIVAGAAYAAVFVKMLRLEKAWARWLVVTLASLGASAVSLAIGMAIAFNLEGT